jgi:hypothetical protein
MSRFLAHALCRVLELSLTFAALGLASALGRHVFGTV